MIIGKNRFKCFLTAMACLISALVILSSSLTCQAMDLAKMRDNAVNAYKAKNYAKVIGIYNQYLDDGGQRVGRTYALLAFMRGHAGYEKFKKAGIQRYHGNYDDEIITPLTDSLQILRTDIVFKLDLLGKAYYDKLKINDFNDVESENNAVWYQWNSLNMRYEDVKNKDRSTKQYTTFCKYLILFVNNCMDIVENIEHPSIYTRRIRNAVKLGFGSKYDDRFWQLYEMTFFDGENIKAGLLWQKGLDMMVDDKSPTDKVLAKFERAIEYTNGKKEKAEIFRQMADLTSQIDEQQRKIQAVEYGEKAFKLDPLNPEIRRQYGSALHVLSYANYNRARFDDALKFAEKGISFDWDGIEVAYWDISRVLAEYGKKIESIRHAKRAFEMARRKYSGAEFSPYVQNYVNILKQFGEERRAREIQRISHHTK